MPASPDGKLLCSWATGSRLLPHARRICTRRKVIVCQEGLGRNTYATDGELLVPAPKAAKARRRVRKSVNFFVGCQSGLPTEVGVVHQCPEISAADFARKVAQS